MANRFECFRCKSIIKRTVETCTKCLRDFHPKCTNASCHRIYDDQNNLVQCTGPYEIFKLQPEGKKVFKRRRTIEVEYDKDEIEDENDSNQYSHSQELINNSQESINNLQINYQLQNSNNSKSQKNTKDNTSNNIISTQVNSSQETDKTQNNSNPQTYDQLQLLRQEIASIRSFIEETVRKEIRELKTTLTGNIALELNKSTEPLKRDIMEVKNLCNSLLYSNQQCQNNITDPSITKKTNNVNSKNERIVITPLQQQRSQDTLNKLKNSIDVVKLGVGVDKIVTKPSGEIVINLEKNNNNTTFSTEIKNVLGDEFKVSAVDKVLPKIKIIGLEKDLLQMNENEFLDILFKQNELEIPTEKTDNHLHSCVNNNNSNNFSDDDYGFNNNDNVNNINQCREKIFCNNSNIKIVKRYGTKTGYGSAIISVDSKIHKKILQNNKVKIGWRNYRVFDYINVTRCFNCWGFNHFKDKCTKKERCRICAENHNEKECQSNVKNCTNCQNINNNSETSCPTDHVATDLNCYSYKKILDKIKLNNLSNTQ